MWESVYYFLVPFNRDWLTICVLSVDASFTGEKTSKFSNLCIGFCNLKIIIHLIDWTNLMIKKICGILVLVVSSTCLLLVCHTQLSALDQNMSLLVSRALHERVWFLSF